jgi:hypothetical protein
MAGNECKLCEGIYCTQEDGVRVAHGEGGRTMRTTAKIAECLGVTGSAGDRRMLVKQFDDVTNPVHLTEDMTRGM